MPARAQHSGSLRGITARQLQALVRPQHGLSDVLWTGNADGIDKAVSHGHGDCLLATRREGELT